MQSVRRQIKRGNAVIAFNNVTKSAEIIQKKGTDSNIWIYALKNRISESEEVYIDSITLPLSQNDIVNSNKMNIYKRPKSKFKV